MTHTAEGIREAGLNRGWNAANYANAYGGDPMEGVDDHVYSGAPGFRDAFRKGIERFKNGQNPNGTTDYDDDDWC